MRLTRSRFVVVDVGSNRVPLLAGSPVCFIIFVVNILSHVCALTFGMCRNPATMGLCSKCYRETQTSVESKDRSGSGAAPPTAGRPEPAAMPAAVEVKDVLAEKVNEEPQIAVGGTGTDIKMETTPVDVEVNKLAVVEPEKPVQKNKSRCFSCNKKVGLLGFECRCGYVYCSGHRHAADHACTFDYASFDRDRLAKANPVVAAAKVDKF